jgi:nitrate reductase (NAD(P)H)
MLTDASQFHIGTLVKSGASTSETTDQTTDGIFLDKTKWKDVKLTKIVQINHDTYQYRLDLQREDQPLGLPVGEHVFVRLRRKDTGELVQRAYTPVSQPGAIGSIELLIKLVSSI